MRNKVVYHSIKNILGRRAKLLRKVYLFENDSHY